ncbi:MAG: Hsp70 family protein, partial [Woeseia sp.]
SDAESHAEEDRKFRELVDTRNKADGLIHAAEKTITELGDKATDEDRAAVEAAVSDLKEALKSDDPEQIEAKINALTEASGAVAQKLYAEQAAEGAAEGEAADGQAASGKDDVVDAEFEEVDDDKKKSS